MFQPATGVRTYAHMQKRRYAHTQVRPYPRTHIRRYPGTQVRRYSQTDVRTYAHTQVLIYARTHIKEDAKRNEHPRGIEPQDAESWQAPQSRRASAARRSPPPARARAAGVAGGGHAAAAVPGQQRSQRRPRPAVARACVPSTRLPTLATPPRRAHSPEAATRPPRTTAGAAGRWLGHHRGRARYLGVVRVGWDAGAGGGPYEVRVPQERRRRETSRWLSGGLEQTTRSLKPILHKRGSRRLIAGK